MLNPDHKLKKLQTANEKLKDSLKNCSICPRRCGVDRTKGKLGYCRAGCDPVVYSYFAHHGEEPAISGSSGSGTIFFSHCNMKCAYCQNYYFSQLDQGKSVSITELARIMLELQKLNCHNINLVSPTHFVPQILLALEEAVREGLAIPIVYNTSGYDLAETLKALKDIIDIYLPDMRYADNAMAGTYSDAPDYVEHNRSAIKEMQGQVGDLVIDENGIAQKGLIIRLLVMPNDVSGTVRTLSFIKQEISPNACLSIMSQYYPTFKAYSYNEISRGVTAGEYKNVVDEARDLGLNNGWIQEVPEEPDGRFLGTNIKPKNG